MALNTHHFFTNSLRANEDIVEAIGGNIYLTSYEEELEENLPLPYMIVSHMGTTNDAESKDGEFEGNVDIDNIEIEIAAESDAELVEIAQKVRDCIKDAVCNGDSQEEYGFNIADYAFSSNGVVFDWTKPCFYCVLSYRCETII